ncbi:hypothetical protein chiPu_0028390 [Chiloscyllium punctatum]|uniref:Uncharacterized protein n=1 Tax=Chiloscyllium punctatum TaxID=137246 RepID=A0A401TPL7_CHIPU|nr:hypothetical protein [Chiloscyllium punctatum]
MYDRILTGPVIPEEGRKRGRRPKHLAAAMQVNSLLATGMLDVGSLQSFQKDLQLAGLVSYPPGVEAKERGEGSRPHAGLGAAELAVPESQERPSPQAAASSASAPASLNLNSLVLSNVYGGMFLTPGFSMALPQLPLAGVPHPGKGQEGHSVPYGLPVREVDDSLSQGYDSADDRGDYAHSLIDDPMMPTNSDLSGED